ncbi:MAG: CdaR family protein [Bacillota bacterium]|nr:CdaR family protein [Bacillota bacterium]MDW7676355.1 CdaR family protein [Bacillota bacterium]
MTKLMNRNLAAKLISVFFAMILWLYVMSVINPRITSEVLNVPVQLMNESIIRQSGLVVFGQPEINIRVRLSGNRDQVQRVTRENIDARIDLRGYTEGTNSIAIEVNVPGGVDVDWSPKFATIELERIVSKQKEVAVEIEGQPASGYLLGEPQLRPNLVWIEGPESYVNSVEKIVAELTLEGQRENVSLNLPLRAVNSRGEEVTQVDVRTTLVDILLPIDQLKSVGVDLDLDIQAAEGFQIVSVITDPVNATIRGQEQTLADITRLSTELFQLEDLDESTEFQIPIIFPEGVRPVDQQMVTVRIEVERVLEETYVVPRETFRTRNFDPDLILQQDTLPERLEVTIRAQESIVESLDPRTIQVFIDLDDLGEGVHTIIPIIQLPMNLESSLSITDVSPETFVLELVPRD